MATLQITMRIMPDSPDSDLEQIKAQAQKLIAEVGQVAKTEEVPVAFGLKSVNVTFFMDEDKGATDPLEEKLVALDSVVSAEVVEISRTF